MLNDTFGAAESAITFARVLYKRGIAPLGASRVTRMYAEGLDPAFRPALDYIFSRKLAPADQAVMQRVESMRTAFDDTEQMYHMTRRDGSIVMRSGAHLAHISSVAVEWGMFLYLCAKGFRSANVLELGSCAGISGTYLASAPAVREFITIERSPDVHALAAKHIRSVKPNAVVLNGDFDNLLDGLLVGLTSPIDLYYIDGNHFYEPTLRYFRVGVPHLARGALVVFDDIHWSKEMWDAWRELRAYPGFSQTLDAGRFGLCIWHGGAVRPRQFDVARYAGWLWDYAPRREVINGL